MPLRLPAREMLNAGNSDRDCMKYFHEVDEARRFASERRNSRGGGGGGSHWEKATPRGGGGGGGTHCERATRQGGPKFPADAFCSGWQRMERRCYVGCMARDDLFA